MTYDAPQIHEVGTAEDVIQGVMGLSSDTGETYPPQITLDDFDE
jgi:hypothetical protein